MVRLKADLHTHAADDPWDRIGYSAEMLIDSAAQLKIDVLGIACHQRVLDTSRLAAYAERRGVLLIPAVELKVEGKHVVVLNPDARQASASTYAELRTGKRPDAVVMAPHPFYPEGACLHGDLLRNIDVFDAVEYCCLYVRGWNLNRRAVAIARKFGLPLIGTTDTHAMPYCDSTVSWIDVETPSVTAVIAAIRAGRVSIETRPRPWPHVLRMVTFFARDKTKSIAGRLR